MVTPGNPLQQAMSPHHTSPLSPPVRGSAASRTNIVPPASPQLPASRATPQYPTSQVSPHIHAAGSMSPSARIAAYSPKQQMGPNFQGQTQLNPDYKSNAPVRTSIHRSDGTGRGFMSPPRMMSPPPVQAPSIPQGSRLPNVSISYNGDASTQQYYNQPGRYPHSWQTVRQQPPVPTNQKISAGPGANLPSSAQIPRPTHFNTSQQVQQASQFGQTTMQVNQPGFQQLQRAPANSLNSNVMLSNTQSTSLNIDPSNDFENDFNLDSLLSDPVEGAGSFMEQLQAVAPSSTSNIFPSSSSSLASPGLSQPLQIPSSMTGITSNTTKVNAQNVVGTSPVSTVSNSSFLNAPTNMDSSNVPVPPAMTNNSFSPNEEERLDSGEITLESTEQDLFKAAASLPIPFADANLPSSMNIAINELKQQQQQQSSLPVPHVPAEVTEASSSNQPAVAAASNSAVLQITTSLLTSPTSSVTAPYANRKLSSELVSQTLSMSESSAMNSLVTTLAASTSPDVLSPAKTIFQSTPAISMTTVAASASNTQPTVTQTLLPTPTPSIQSSTHTVQPSPTRPDMSNASRPVLPAAPPVAQQSVPHSVQLSVPHSTLSAPAPGLPAAAPGPYSSAQVGPPRLPGQSSEMVRSKMGEPVPYPMQQPSLMVSDV